MKKIFFSTLSASFLLTANLYANSFSATFEEDIWNDKNIPEEHVCSDYNVEAGSTPAINLKNIPVGTTNIQLEFSDETFKGMRNGGHGIISYNKISSPDLLIPAIEGETFDLPDGFTSVIKHRAGKYGKTPGAYLAPCSGGKGNTYSVIIKAMKNTKVLSTTSLTMGIY
jgi:hypothetical protein